MQAGKICYLEIPAADVEVSSAFYAKLFGWTYPPGGFPGYTYVESGVPSGTIPGTFTVKLTAGGKTYTQPIVVKQDPRVKTPALVMQQVYAQSKAAYYSAVEAQQAAADARRLRERIAAVQPQASGAVAAALEALGRKLETLAPPAPAAMSRRVWPNWSSRRKPPSSRRKSSIPT
jgi:hypothetical protein